MVAWHFASIETVNINFSFIFIKILGLDNIITHHWSVLGVSAVTGEKLLTSIDWLIDDISRRIFTLD